MQMWPQEVNLKLRISKLLLLVEDKIKIELEYFAPVNLNLVFNILLAYFILFFISYFIDTNDM